MDPRDRPPPDPEDAGLHHQDVRSSSPRWRGSSCSTRPGRSSPRASTSRSTSTRRTGRGSSASPLLPDGDLFKAIKKGKVSVVTDTIERFDAKGIQLASGERLDADVVITATGFDLSVMGDVAFVVDGQEVDWADTVTYRGLMFTGVPNLAYVFGYFRASWTLRADIITDFVCRLLAHMEEIDKSMVVPVRDDDGELRPWVEPDNFNPGYLTRSMHKMPKQGTEAVAPRARLHAGEGDHPERRPRRRDPRVPLALAAAPSSPRRAVWPLAQGCRGWKSVRRRHRCARPRRGRRQWPIAMPPPRLVGTRDGRPPARPGRDGPGERLGPAGRGARGVLRRLFAARRLPRRLQPGAHRHTRRRAGSAGDHLPGHLVHHGTGLPECTSPQPVSQTTTWLPTPHGRSVHLEDWLVCIVLPR